MEKREHTGRGELIERLSEQVGSKSLAISILQKRGHLEDDGVTLTAAGEVRNAMTAEERAIDRESRRRGVPADQLKYNPKTNRATESHNFLP